MGHIRALEPCQNAGGLRSGSPGGFDPVAQVIDPVVAAVFDVPLDDLRATTRGAPLLPAKWPCI
jgi:hypothetical protein